MEFYDFPFTWECEKNIPTDFHSIIFQRGLGSTTKQVNYHVLWLKSPFFMGKSTISMEHMEV